MDNRTQHYGQQRPAGDQSFNRSLEGNQLQGAGMADIDVSESKLRGLDVIGTSAGALMLLGPLVAVAIAGR